MAGLLQQGMQKAPRQPPGAAQGQPRPEPQGQPAQGQQPAAQGAQRGARRARRRGGQEDAPPEQAQQQMTALLEAGLGYLYGDGMKPAVKAMQNAPSPQDGMAKVIGSVMLTAFNTLQSSGARVPPNVMMAFGINLSKAVGEMAVEAGVMQSDDPEAIEGAFMDGLARFGQLVDKQALSRRQKQRYAEMIRGMRELKEGGQAGEQPRGEPTQGDPGPPRRPQAASPQAGPQPPQGGM